MTVAYARCARLSGNVSRLNWGVWRERGMVRMSTSSSIACAFRMSYLYRLKPVLRIAPVVSDSGVHHEGNIELVDHFHLALHHFGNIIGLLRGRFEHQFVMDLE